MRLSDFPIIQKRYVQLLRVIQSIHCILTLMLLYQGISSDEPLAILNAGLISNLAMIFIIQLLIVQLKRGRVELAVGIHQMISLCFMIMQGLMFSGVSSPNTAAFHLSLLMVSIYTRQKYYWAFVAIVLSAVIGIGLNDIFGWIAINHSAPGKPDLVITLLLVCLYTGFMSWVLIRDLKFAYTEKVKEHERIEEAKTQIQNLADTDQLTGLLNRYGAYNKFENLQLETDFNQSSIVMMFIDVDDFKSVNDQYGHYLGDEVLSLVGQRLRNVVDDNALISRLGGDEFVIALRQDKSFELNLILDKVLSEMSDPFTVEGVAVEITSTIGVAVAEDSEQTFDELCRKADIAMYQAKVDGKNNYCHYRDDLAQAYMANHKLLKGMQEAVENNDLALHYQPKFDTKTNQIVGAEALLRWEKNNPMGYTTQHIIHVIETTNLIHEVGYWALRKACQDCKVWQEAGADLAVSVNISARQFADENFAENVKNILNEVDLPASSLILEISENELTQEGCNVVTQLQQIKEYGVKLAIDCFGVGYSNLAYLADLEVDELKMDRGFTHKLTSSYKARSIITAFVKMANQLGMRLVALGVEKEEDNLTLQSLGCVIGQGFLWKKPITAQEFGQLVS